MKVNEEAIKALLPETWTHVGNLNLLQFGWKLKLLGVDWRRTDELISILLFLENSGFLLRDGFVVKRNPRSIL